jgi:ureidoglycolate lyase
VITVEPLTADAFAPFGRVVDSPERESDASGPGWRWWAETELLPAAERAYGLGYLELDPGPTSFDWAERHERTEELVVALRGDSLLYVGPAADDDPVPDHFRIFRIRPGQAALMNRRVWHGAPLAGDTPAAALVVLLEGTGREDVRVVRFEDTPVEVRT